MALGNLVMVADDILSGRLMAPFGKWMRGPYDIYIGRASAMPVNPLVDEVYGWLVESAKRHAASLDEVLKR